MQLLEQEKEEADDLFYLMTHGSRQEQSRAREALREWTGGNADRQRYVEELGEFDRLVDSHLGNLRNEYARVFTEPSVAAAATNNTAASPASAARAQPRSKKSYTWFAAGLSVFGAAAVALYAINPVLSTQAFHSDVGQQTQVALQDGSQLLLNTETSGTVEYRLRSREVTLASGEALFSVVHNGLRPFVVDTGDARIEDIGTVFSVRSLDRQVTVAVLQGEVEMSLPSADQRVFLRARQAGMADGSEIKLVDGDQSFDNLVSWKDQHLVFTDEPLALVIKELQRYRKQPITFMDDRARNIRITGGFASTDPDNLLKALPAVAPVTVRFRANGEAVIASR